MNADLKKRVITAGILILVFILCTVLSVKGFWSSALMWLTAVAVALAAWEFATICNKKRPFWWVINYFIVLILPTALILLGSDPADSDWWFSKSSLPYWLGSLFSIFYALALLIICGYRSLEEAENLAKDIFIGIILVGLGGSAVVFIAGLAATGIGMLAPIFLILVVCANDIAAYFCGKKFGGPAMAPIISPNKTISGSIGGFVGGGLVGCLVLSCIFFFLVPKRVEFENTELSSLDGVPFCLIAFALSLIFVAAAQMGDLLKSYVKRIHNVKDSGKILPGHGGVLDRIDGILLAAFLLAPLIILLNSYL
ncbi:MAG: phosphatidate cytidylyltransferase [Bdellovibrionota bacterium]|jgi:phosphatidate cytidylyltransferase